MNKKRNNAKNNKIIVLALGCIAVLLLILLLMLVLLIPKSQEEAPETSAPTTAPTVVTTVPTEEPTEETTEATTVPEETEPQMIPEMAEYYNENSDFVGWMTIEGTKVDYPVMHSPDDPEKYLRLNFEEEFSVSGLPFLDANCSIDPDSDNLLIYGHNMANGTMFNSLLNYGTKTYWEQHPTIKFTTLYEERTYEIIAAFYDRIRYTYEEGFRFYRFIDAEDEAAFNEAITYYKENAVYDTGVTAEYGDKLMTLITCAYHHEYGRFVVVAKDITDDLAATAAETE